MKQIIFIAGTDTGVGKTHVSTRLLNTFRQEGLSTLGLKPIASGCTLTPDGLRNEDALHLQAASSVTLPYNNINPIAFEPPIAPHIAARKTNDPISVERLIALCQPALTANVDRIIIEGVGGWLVPLNEKETMADFVKALAVPTILVVGMRLGCINHALLTCQAINASGVELHGWIANCLEPTMMDAQNENIQTLTARIDAPRLDVIDFSPVCPSK